MKRSVLAIGLDPACADLEAFPGLYCCSKRSSISFIRWPLRPTSVSTRHRRTRSTLYNVGSARHSDCSLLRRAGSHFFCASAATHLTSRSASSLVLYIENPTRSSDPPGIFKMSTGRGA